MAIHISLDWVLGVLLIAVRLGIAWFGSGIQSVARVPVVVRTCWILALAAVMATEHHYSWPDYAIELWCIRLFNEVVNGMLFALGLQIIWGALMTAGRWLDYQIGFGIANLIDPSSHAAMPLTGTILALLVGCLFFSAGWDHALVRMVSQSLTSIPLGETWQYDPKAVADAGGMLFRLAISLAAPVLLALLFLDIAIALVARMAPQLNVFFLGIPIKLAVGLAVLASTSVLLGSRSGLLDVAIGFWNRLGI